MARLKWYGDEIQAKVKAHFGVQLRVAAGAFRDYLRQQLGERYRMPTEDAVAKRNAANVSLRELRQGYGHFGEGEVAGEAEMGIERATRRRDRARSHVNRLRKIFASSPPGGYPGMRTGWLRMHVQQETDRVALVARVGTNVPYGRYLEFGTSKMLPRPWLSLGLREFGPQIIAILQTPVAK